MPDKVAVMADAPGGSAQPVPRSEPEARVLCKRLALAFQKARSNMMESELEDVAEILNPWLFGPKSILPLLAEIADGKRRIDPSGMHNILYIANRPEMRALFGIWSSAYEQEDGTELPTPGDLIAAGVLMEWPDGC